MFVILKIIGICLSGTLASFCLTKYAGLMRNRYNYKKLNYQKLANYQLQAYDQLNNTLYSSSINLGCEKIYHSLFFSAKDYFQYINSLVAASKKSFWFSNSTTICLNEYIETLNKRSLIYGLTKTSDNALVQNFGTGNYDIFEHYQTKLLNSIICDNNLQEDFISFLQSKKDTNKNLNRHEYLNNKLHTQFQHSVKR
jgi:hypothetical protein